MKTFTNMKIGRKLALVLGTCVFLLASLAGLSMWGTRTMERIESLGRDRLTKAE